MSAFENLEDLKDCKIKRTAVYYQIVDKEENLVCFMSIRDGDYQNAETIIKALNFYYEHNIDRGEK